MHRIDTSTAQVDKFGAGKNGFTGGNPQTGELPTALDQDFFDSIQEEISAPIEAAGLTLQKASRNQLLEAIRTLIRTNKRQVRYTASGSFTVPDGVTTLYVSGCGGGGGGGGSQTSINATVAGSGGGSSGGFVIKAAITVTPGTVLPVTIGQGGLGGSAGGGAGNNGGATVLGSTSLVNLVGGGGGAVGQSNTTSASGGAPGSVSGSAPGGWGGDSQAGEGGGAYGGMGGACPFGSAGAPVRGNSSPIAGQNAVGYGAGGGGAGGANVNGAHTGAKGGDGANGILVIEW